jgi:hypothetical protein
MRNRTLFELTLLVVLSYTLLELILRQFFVRLPDAFHAAGITIVVASTPWSLLAMDLFRAVETPVQQVARDFAYLMVIGVGAALNVVLLRAALSWVISQIRR